MCGGHQTHPLHTHLPACRRGSGLHTRVQDVCVWRRVREGEGSWHHLRAGTHANTPTRAPPSPYTHTDRQPPGPEGAVGVRMLPFSSSSGSGDSVVGADGVVRRAERAGLDETYANSEWGVGG